MSTPVRLLLSAFEPFGGHEQNASQLCLAQLELPSGLEITTRIYPVDFSRTKIALEADLEQAFDGTLHLGQAANISEIHLEAFAINAGKEPDASDHFPLCADGPPAYQTSLPLGAWAQELRSADLPAKVSCHAGTYLCNATYYWARQWAAQRSHPRETLFIHLPLASEQAEAQEKPSLPASQAAQGVRRVLDRMAELLQAQRV